MKLPNQSNSIIRPTIGDIHTSSANRTGVLPAASCCVGNPNPVCNIFGRINCPPGFACRQSRFCFGDVCLPIAFCAAQNLTIGFGQG